MANPTRDAPIQRAANSTGLPDKLKAGVESLSGRSLDHVRVHLNSPKPAQLRAHAYAQGSDIHVGPGQEKHLPHEAWHVVQQMQGRVKPTTHMKKGVPLNDDAGLENEADRMGTAALQLKAPKPSAPRPRVARSASAPRGGVVQRDPWDAAANVHEANLAGNLNALGGVGGPPHRIDIGPQAVNNAHGVPITTTGAQKHFDADMLREVSRVLHYLPPSHIIGNPALTRVVMENTTAQNPGVSYFGGGQLHILVPGDAPSWVYLSMSKWPVGEIATTPMTNIGYSRNNNNANLGPKIGESFSRDVLGTGTIGNKLDMLREDFVRWLITHETGHSVDAAIGFVGRRYYRRPDLGGWLIHDQGGDTDETTMGTRILSGLGLGRHHMPQLDAAYLAQTGTDFSAMFDDALNNRNPHAFNVPNRRQARHAFQQGGSPLAGGGGPAAPVAHGAWKADRLESTLLEGMDSPWQKGGSGGLPLGSRTYQVEFQHSRWVSYDSAKYALRNSNYQMSGPAEWFAETYAHYFTHSSLRFWRTASSQWGEKLNDPQARAWFLNNLDIVNNPHAALVVGNTLNMVPNAPLAMPLQNVIPVPGMAERVVDAIGDVAATVLQVGVSGLFRLLSTVFLLPVGLIKYLAWFPVKWLWRKLLAWLFP